jgi:hypothetical protein
MLSPDIFLEPGSVTGQTCLDSAANKGYLHLVNLMKRKLEDRVGANVIKLFFLSRLSAK